MPQLEGPTVEKSTTMYGGIGGEKEKKNYEEKEGKQVVRQQGKETGKMMSGDLVKNLATN